MSEPRYAYILVYDAGYNGYSPPIQVFMSESDAKAVQSVATDPLRVFKTPVWPTPQSKKWYDL